MAMDALKELDERIQASVNRIQQLQRENQALAQRLAESEQRLTEAGNQLKQLDSQCRQHAAERDEIKGRIEKILTRFDGLDLG